MSLPSPKPRPRLAAGRARALGLPTRGTTKPNRLRRMDNWITARLASELTAAADPLVIDLGYGATPVTAVELLARLRRVRGDVRVLGIELDAERVAAAQPVAASPWLTFERGGFELGGHRPAIVRAANVLRQYDEAAAAEAWQTMRGSLAPGGVIVEGTCDEIGRLAAWVLLGADGPRCLTFACRADTLIRPARLAERLPKALIHRNAPGEPIHAFLRAFDAAWDATAAISAFGPRQHWIAASNRLAADGWEVDVSRARHGEITVAWSVVAPR